MKTFATILLIFVANIVFANMPQYEIDIKQIVQAFVTDMEKDPRIKCIARGGSMPHDIEAVELKFTVKQNGASIEEARYLEVTAIEKLKNMINSSEKIRPCLHEYPFPSKRVKISFSFRGPKKTKADMVEFVCQGKGFLTYFAPDQPDGKVIELLEESYEDALKIVSGEKKVSDLNIKRKQFYE